jgi:WD40 repeat protein
LASLEAGARLGPYEVLSPLGAGGMGEVYRARDTRLGREVAVKVLPAAAAADPRWRERFEREARAASALNHPNIVTVHDVGTEGSTFYIAMELVAGKTLRELLRPGPLPTKKLLEIAVPIAEGLAQAHDAGIVHRDLKPDNLMVSREGRVKILDFGLSKLVEPPPEDLSEAPTLGERATRTGMVLGTVGYMSPEQASGEEADFRSDQFSLGAILYEMATGRRAFSGATAAETLAAVLRDEPPSLEGAGIDVPEPLRWVIERCLTKDRESRYGSTRDLAWDLRLLRERSSGIARLSGTGPPGRVRGRARLRIALAAAGVLTLGTVFLAGLFLSGRSAPPPPTFERLTFRRGTVWSARFAPDGQTVIYSAAWEGRPVQLFETRVGSTESRPLDLGAANVLSISSKGEMALSLDPRFPLSFVQPGTLARAPLTGGAPREMVRDVHSADWMPDGREIVFSRNVSGKERLELSSGRVLYEAPKINSVKSVINSVRVSPDGHQFAFFEYSEQGASVVVLDRGGEPHVLSSGWHLWSVGLAWAPSGREIWFTAARGDEGMALRAVDLSGHERLMARVPGDLRLRDVFRDGRVLLAHARQRLGLVCLPPGATRERDLSWRDYSFLGDLAPDGRTVAFAELSAAGGASLFLRGTDGSPAVRLAAGVALGPVALSPDGQRVLAVSVKPPRQLLLLPTGPGPTRRLPHGEIQAFDLPRWLPDGSGVVFLGDEAGKGTSLYLQDVANGAIRRIASGIDWGLAVAPDGRSVAAARTDGTLALYALDGSGSRAVAKELLGNVIGWSSDGRFLYSHRVMDLPGKIYRTDVETGATTVWKELMPADPAGVWRVHPVRITPDGRSYAYTYVRQLSDLYVYEGLR